MVGGEEDDEDLAAGVLGETVVATGDAGKVEVGRLVADLEGADVGGMAVDEALGGQGGAEKCQDKGEDAGHGCVGSEIEN